MQKEAGLKFPQLLSIVLLTLTAINACFAGILFIIDPTGDKMGMNITYLQYSPFTNYFIPGLILFIVNGILNLTAAYFLYIHDRKAPFLVLLQGILLCGWIIIQVIMVHDIMVLHTIMFLTGAILLICGIHLFKRQ